ncbi:helix-turn-helix domain-containing protein [Acinetobacter defluvii]|uniref:helix-turn-helix domain-containing protein n=1 Tax=Acinetobacter defluvii TaxID=1871111 RepID=UPI003AF55DCA
MPRTVKTLLTSEEKEQLEDLTKHAAHWRERQRAQTILWLANGETVEQVAARQKRIPETIRLQRRRWIKDKFKSIKEGERSGRPGSISDEYQAIILNWVKEEPLNAEQVRTRLHEKYTIDIKVHNIRRFLKLSGMVFKRTRHSLKKKKSDCI